MERIAELVTPLLDGALARHVGSAAAVSVGNQGAEVFRLLRGHVRRVPDLGPPIDDTTYFDLASLTKPIATVASAMVLVGDNRLDLDTPIRYYLPDAASTGTVRHLLGHSAGCAAHVEFFRGGHRPYADLVGLAAREPLAYAPGTSTIYSDLGFLQLGAIVERAADAPLDHAFSTMVARPLDLTARFPGTTALPNSVATEIDPARGGLVCGLVHDENAYYSGGICGHAGLFATLSDVATFARAIVETAGGRPHGRLRPEIIHRFARESAAPNTTWRLGWDSPSPEPGVSHAGDAWPRANSIGHGGFTGTSIWLDLANRRWAILLTNRVHPTRGGTSADDIKALRRELGTLSTFATSAP
jgi:serine-type D-Ala-D-Ala carboxypeptidase